MSAQRAADSTVGGVTLRVFRRPPEERDTARSVGEGLPPIPGLPLDPPPRPAPRPVRYLKAREGRVGLTAGSGYRAVVRFTHARVTLLAAGTTYYLFLGLLSLVTLAYGLTAALGTDWLAEWVTTAVSEAFPDVGTDTLDVDDIQSAGQTISLVSAVGLLYGATGAVMAAVRSLHTIYGAPKDPTPWLLARLKAVGWLLVLGPMILVSYVAATVSADVSDRLLHFFGLEWSGPRPLLLVVAVVLTLVLDFSVIYLMLARLGGIRPRRSALLWGAGAGTVGTEIVKLAMALLVGLVVAKPQYGALTAPIAIMFVLFVQSQVVYGAAALTAGVAEGLGNGVRPDEEPDA